MKLSMRFEANQELNYPLVKHCIGHGTAWLQ